MWATMFGIVWILIKYVLVFLICFSPSVLVSIGSAILIKIIMGVCNKSIDEDIFATICSIILALFFVGNMCYECGVGSETRETTKEVEYELYAFEDNQGFYINQSLFSGHGEDELVYYYTIKNNDGSFNSKRAEADESRIIYTKEMPKVVYKYFSYENEIKWHTKLTSKLIPRKDNIGWMDGGYEFYVPEGTVKNEYNSDLKN